MQSMLQLQAHRSFSPWLQDAQSQFVKLKQSTAAGLSADMNTENGLHDTFILNSVVGPRSVFVASKVSDKLIEGVTIDEATTASLNASMI